MEMKQRGCHTGEVVGVQKCPVVAFEGTRLGITVCSAIEWLERILGLTSTEMKQGNQANSESVTQEVVQQLADLHGVTY